MPHPLAVLSSPSLLAGQSTLGHTISNLLTSQLALASNKMTKAFVLVYMAAFVATRVAAFAPASSRTQSLVDAATASKQQQFSRASSPLFMSDDDDVSFLRCLS